jgi:hypothetical protein
MRSTEHLPVPVIGDVRQQHTPVGILDIISGIADFIASWRFYLGVLLSVPFAIWLHDRFGSSTWVWFVSVPIVVLGIGGGWVWQWNHDKSTINK